MSALKNIFNSLSIILMLLCSVSVSPLYSQNDIVKEMDSLGKALENDSLARADSSIEIKPIGQPRVLLDSIAKSLNKSTKLPAPLKKDSTKSAAQQNTIEKKSEELLGNKNTKNKSETKSDEADDKLETIAKLISGDNIFYSIVFLVFGYFIIRLLSYLLNALAERSPNYRITFKGAIPIIKIVTWSTIITLIIVVVF